MPMRELAQVANSKRSKSKWSMDELREQEAKLESRIFVCMEKEVPVGGSCWSLIGGKDVAIEKLRELLSSLRAIPLVNS